MSDATRSLLRRLASPAAFLVAFGVLTGLGTFTFVYGEGAAYLSNDPAACVNCHVMQESLRLLDRIEPRARWRAATTATCRTTRSGKWITKADNGLFHSIAFTTGNFPDPIRIKPRNREVTQAACLHCHRDFVHNMLPARPGDDMLLCVHCHADVGHAGRR